ncbi:hypothetical protein [Desulfosudis oleivorans]|uniref:Lipoprotein n=1 Tax=Desulfosudis oleivorans (strain DSM 6200 / JCM 39069 / Hxd3) TaxID=96561 RepID=A8ZYX4_DESOH|nr:hypothetical protein [Desulfosudis oleivorans]ABW68747.1 hypothetical protein Dole_2944 [Desulfosudis oleivorans Hxd3]
MFNRLVGFSLICSFLLVTTACTTPKYKMPIEIPDRDVGLQIQDPIPTQINICMPTLVSNKIHAYQSGRPHYGYDIEIDEKDLTDSFQKALTQTVQQSNLYQSVAAPDTEDREHSLNTKIWIENIRYYVPTPLTEKVSEVKVEYIVTSKNGKILASGTVAENGVDNDIGFFKDVLKQSINAVQDALSKAAARIPVELAENDPFVQVAKADADPNYVISYKPTKPVQQEEGQQLQESEQRLAELMTQQTRQNIAHLNELIDSGNKDEFMAFIEQYPDLADHIENPAYRLLYTGPKELRIGTIAKMLEHGFGDKVIVAKINGVKEPYRDFSFDELVILKKLKFSDDIIAAMLNVTTELNREQARIAREDALLEEQRKGAQETGQNQSYIANQPQSDQNAFVNAVGQEAGRALGREAVKELLDRLF